MKVSTGILFFLIGFYNMALITDTPELLLIKANVLLIGVIISTGLILFNK